MNSNKENNQLQPKQVIVVRKDLDMPSGKMAAQVAHASLGALFKCGVKTETELHITMDKDSAIEKWLNNRFTKVVLSVKSEEAIKKVYQNALNAGLPTVLIEDAGFTVFGKPTITCVGIGPSFPNEFIGITDKLQVYR